MSSNSDKDVKQSPNSDAGSEGNVSASHARKGKGKRKARRQRNHREKHPERPFLVATHPSQFKESHNRRQVRSMAMQAYRQSENERSEDSGAHSHASASPQDAGYPISRTQMAPTLLEWQVTLPATSGKIDTPEPHYDVFDASMTGQSQLGPVRPHRTSTKINNEDPDQDTKFDVERLFAGLPTSDDYDINLLRTYMEVFATESTLNKWLPKMLSHPDLILSATGLGSTWLDMKAGVSWYSERTNIIKGRILAIICERMEDPNTQDSDETLAIIANTALAELWVSDETALRVVFEAAAGLIARRGGLNAVANLAIAKLSSGCCFLRNIICETPPCPILQGWQPVQCKYEESAVILESPLFCPQTEFISLDTEYPGSVTTFGLLGDMRDLTRLVAKRNIYQGDHFNDQVSEIRERVAVLPSAYTTGHPLTHDWVYESCRITALIYTASIILRVPFSMAADPVVNADVFNTSFDHLPEASESQPLQHLSTILRETLGRCGTVHAWGNMAGVYYWICLVGAVAARTRDSTDAVVVDWVHGGEDRLRSRRCFVMNAIQAMMVLILHHDVPVLVAMRTLLTIQEHLASEASG